MIPICPDKVKLNESSGFHQASLMRKEAVTWPPSGDTLGSISGLSLGVPMGVDEEQAHWA